MSNNFFHFKKFTLNQDKCAMKVGTDGVLLGAWSDTGNAKCILDVGTGTGLIAIMLAQRSRAMIDAVEVDSNAFQQATENVKTSPWPNRVNVFNESFQNFSGTSNKKYDLIVTNPPYFKNSFKPSGNSRIIARHDNLLPANELINGIDKLLNKSGRFCIILPFDVFDDFVSLVDKHDFYPNKVLEVYPKPGKKAHRILAEFSRQKNILVRKTLIIESGGRHVYSDEYINLAREFYLKM